MRITKFPQSCLFVETCGKKLLFDPGNLKYEEHFVGKFSLADSVFITHKHADHCYIELLKKLPSTIPVYMTAETAGAHPDYLGALPIKEFDIITIDGIQVAAVHAVHGYQPKMRGNDVHENIGYLVDDGKIRLYITSDTVCFPADIMTDIIAIPVTGHGVTMSAFEASLFAKETGAKTIILTHMDNPAYEVDFDYINRHFKAAGVEYTLLKTGETFDTKVD